MHVDRISLALTRIETAALRIQDAARSERALAGGDEAGRYHALRKEAAGALAELDRLIVQLER